MELIDQHTKQIMEGCKERARDAGLRFHDETLEYIVTNKDLLELSPKFMIPTLYDYWVHDVDVIRERGRYELYPSNPYETVINTRPAISFYNDNNPDWLNVMIFYHVLGHIDFFQNNLFFKNTWDEDFGAVALADKRLIAKLRSDKGRWVDYVIEFTRGIDNITGYYQELSELNQPQEILATKKINFYFDNFLQNIQKVKPHDYLKEIDRYNDTLRLYGDVAESIFFAEVIKKYPEFEALFLKSEKKGKRKAKDLIQYLQAHSSFLQKEENQWMKSVMQVVRNTSLFFQPQIRTKILHEGWASYWHEKLFLQDDRIKGNEVMFALVNAKVTSLPRVGLNPYALGMRLFSHVEELADKGRISYEFQTIQDVQQRKQFDRETGQGQKFIFTMRENFNDFMFINTFVDQDFVDRHNLFVAGRRLNSAKGVWEYYVKSRDAKEYKNMLLNALYHPPDIFVDEESTTDKVLFLNHRFEGKPLVKDFIANTMLGVEYLWGGPVKLTTTEIVTDSSERSAPVPSFLNGRASGANTEKSAPEYQRVLYTMENRKLRREVLKVTLGAP